MKTLWTLHPLRVRYQETDQMAVVYHGNYVNWFEIGRTEYIRSAGVTYKDIEAKGLMLPVTELEAALRIPAKYDDSLVICTRVTDMSPVRVHFQSQVRRVKEGEAVPYRCTEEELPGESLVTGSTRHVWVNADWKPARLDRMYPELYALLQRLSAGERMEPR